MKFRILYFISVLVYASACQKPKVEEIVPAPPLPAPIAKVPQLITDSITNLTVYSVTMGGAVIDSGGSRVTEQGLVVGLATGATNVSNYNKFTLQTDISGKFKITIVNVPPGTTFYARSYAVNKEGVGYGNEIKFTSPQARTYDGSPVLLTTQDEVNAFGENQYNVIINGITIQGSEIVDLSPLKNLIIIGGSLAIRNTSLQNLKGLDSLEATGQRFPNRTFIEHNPMLKDLVGLNHLKLITGGLQIWDNKAMISLDGFDQLGSVRVGSFEIHECPRLQSLHGLEFLTNVDGDLVLRNNESLSDLKAFRNLATINGSVRILSNLSLPDTDGFEKVGKLITLVVSGNPLLTNLNGFRNLVDIDGLQLENNDLLADLSFIKNLKTTKSVYLRNCRQLNNLNFLSNLESVTEYLTLIGNPMLTSVTGLEKVKTIGAVSIYDNNVLVSLRGLSSLETLTRDNALSISHNPVLQSLAGLENLKSAKDGVSIEYNHPQLEYCALKNLLLQFKGSFWLNLAPGVSLTQAEVLATCP